MKKNIDNDVDLDYTSSTEEDAFQLLEEYLIVVKEWNKYDN